MKKVVKFGGSSLASAEQFRKVGKIILAEDSRRLRLENGTMEISRLQICCISVIMLQLTEKISTDR